MLTEVFVAVSFEDGAVETFSDWFASIPDLNKAVRDFGIDCCRSNQHWYVIEQDRCTLAEFEAEEADWRLYLDGEHEPCSCCGNIGAHAGFCDMMR